MHNPFRPTFGASPRVWAGRDAVLQDFGRALQGGPGNPDRSLLISGSRGIGKTVLLTELEDIAIQQGWVVLRASARENMQQVLVESTIPEAIARLEERPKRQLTGFSVAGIGSVSTHITDSEPAQRLVTQLRRLIDLLHDTGVLITIDEVQDVDPDDLTQIAIAYQDLVRDDLPVAVAMAGLTRGINQLLDLPGATFLRRARHYELGPLTLEDARRAFEETSQEGGIVFAAADQAAELSQGYPYLVQLLGFLAWERAVEDSLSTIDANVITLATPDAVERLGLQVHQPALRDVPPKQLEFLQTMALLEEQAGTPEVPVAHVAELMGTTTTSVSDTRQKLIDRDLITPAGWGLVEFAQPYLGQYLRERRRPKRVQ
ncbi:ATP-binding protein [Corynebacterium riegelii]|uniref:ATP-binding protein n=1 Tax=Corynebacterium riegelii TaxID=156976 RepID=UPI000C7597C6|nr:ATP-binding protein [Corynebacterium riegelii]PLA13020.1 ATP-binding protein [Corynebacterium riegelii]